MKRLAILAAVTALTAAVPANAATFVISFNSGYGAGNGTIVTNGAANTPSLVTSFTGTLAGAAISLLAPGSYPIGTASNDNLFDGTSPYFTFKGVSFAAGGQNYNLYNNGPTVMLCGRTAGCDTTSLSAFTVTAVPEPATWAMMLVGFAMVGAATRYRRRATAMTFA